MIEFKNVTKIFSQRKNKIEAVSNLSFNLTTNSITGLAGMNGAGKTTTLRMLSGLIKPTKGEIFINDIPMPQKREQALQHIGFLTSDTQLYKDMTPTQILYFIGSLRNIPKNIISTKIDEISKRLNLQEYMNINISKLSGGTKQKVSISTVLIFNPDFIILDEPFNELDVPVSLSFRNILKEEKNNGKGILISSHNMHLLKHICDKIIFIHKGRKIIEIEKQQIDKINDMESYFMEIIKGDIDDI